MIRVSKFLFASLAVLCATLAAQESRTARSPKQLTRRNDARPERSWTKALENRNKRGTLSDRSQNVRGDSGKWSEKARLQHAPPIAQKPPKTALDEWCDQLLETDFQVTGDDDNWLLFRTRQLDDNDRVWVERIERRGKRFNVVASHAVWKGRYRKNFTYHKVLCVNLGKLEPGKYEARWIVEPFEFGRFEGSGSPRDNWPKDDRSTDKKPLEFRVSFVVADK